MSGDLGKPGRGDCTDMARRRHGTRGPMVACRFRFWGTLCRDGERKGEGEREVVGGKPDMERKHERSSQWDPSTMHLWRHMGTNLGEGVSPGQLK